MAKKLSISDFGKNITKAVGINTGFTDVKHFMDTGNYALNYLISGNFYGGVPLEGTFTMFAGESQTGKSYISSANMCRWAIENDTLPVLIDTENALSSDWFDRLGIDSTKILRIPAGTVDQMTQVMTTFIKQYKENYTLSTPIEEKQKVVIIIDSIGMAVTSTELNQAEKGDMKGDMGRKAKQLGSMCRIMLSKITGEPIGLVGVNHTYASQDMFKPSDVIAGGNMMELGPRVIVAMKKKKLKDESLMKKAGVKGARYSGVRVDAVVLKTSWGKPFQKTSFNIPYSTGMDKYSGLFDFFKENEYFETAGTGTYIYKSRIDGTEEFRVRGQANVTDEHLILMMKDLSAISGLTEKEIAKLKVKKEKSKAKAMIDEKPQTKKTVLVDSPVIGSVDVKED